MALEHLLTTDEFNKPKVVDGKDAIAKKLLTLLTMNPGTDMLIKMIYQIYKKK